MSKRLLSNDEIKTIELNILLEFRKFCDYNNLKYYLDYGTLLGAVRHKGFIPWDDDIDVCMPRPDYEKFIKTFESHNKRFKLKSNRLNNMDAPFTKMIDVFTTIEPQYLDGNIDTNLWIDIFPIDGLPNTDEELVIIQRKVNFLLKVLLLVDCRLGEGSTIIKKYGKFVLKPLANLIGSKYCVNKIEEMALQYRYNYSRYVGMVVWSQNILANRMLKTEFEEATEVEFEGHKFPAIASWDKYLTGIYGDYMKLPPIEKRRTHNMKAYINE